jgi:4-amino-4-deoxychorismate lyase
LLETIKVQHNEFQHLNFHNERVNYSRGILFQSADVWDLSQLIAIPELDPHIIYKCRLLYSRAVEQVVFLPYTPRIIKKLYIVTDNDLNYSLKYTDRQALDRLKNSITIQQDSDILIVKNGLISDTSFTNIAFYDGSSWYTPDSPLLKGTKREFYLRKGTLIEKKITPPDLPKYQKARLINAMLDLEDGEDIMIEDIIM